MTIYRYGLLRRPMQMGAQPKGFIVSPGAMRTVADYDRYPDRFGTIDYPAPLSQNDLYAYELVFMGEVGRDDAETQYWQSRNTA